MSVVLVQAMTPLNQGAAQDPSGPGKQDSSVGAAESSGAAEPGRPAEAGGATNSPDKQEAGIPISSPGPEAGPTSPGEMTQVALLDAVERQVLECPVPLVQLLTSMTMSL